MNLHLRAQILDDRDDERDERVCPAAVEVERDVGVALDPVDHPGDGAGIAPVVTLDRDPQRVALDADVGEAVSGRRAGEIAHLEGPELSHGLELRGVDDPPLAQRAVEIVEVIHARDDVARAAVPFDIHRRKVGVETLAIGIVEAVHVRIGHLADGGIGRHDGAGKTERIDHERAHHRFIELPGDGVDDRCQEEVAHIGIFPRRPRLEERACIEPLVDGDVGGHRRVGIRHLLGDKLELMVVGDASRMLERLADGDDIGINEAIRVPRGQVRRKEVVQRDRSILHELHDRGRGEGLRDAGDPRVHVGSRRLLRIERGGSGPGRPAPLWRHDLDRDPEVGRVRNAVGDDILKRNRDRQRGQGLLGRPGTTRDEHQRDKKEPTHQSPKSLHGVIVLVREERELV